MNFEVKDLSKMGPQLREIAVEQITAAIADLERCGAATLGEASHQVRRRGKKLRALARLGRGVLGKKTWKREDSCFRDAARRLGKLRDAQVLVKALDALRRHYFERQRPPLITHARRLLSADVRRCANFIVRRGVIVAVTKELQAARARCCDWELQGFGWKEARRALRQSYKRSRATGRAAERDRE